MLIKLPHKFIPRDYQADFMNAMFVDGYKHMLWVLHRRAGKSITAFNMLVMAACRKVGLYLYLLPLQTQARKVIWRAIGGDAVPFLDHVPKSIIRKINNTDMSIELINGAIIQFAGSNNYDNLVGIGACCIMYDEFSISNPLAREYLSPILLESGGTEIVFGTPRGHNEFYELYKMALDNPRWYVKKLTIDETHRSDGSSILTEEQIAEERKAGKSEELIQQEYYCSFETGNVGSYYTKELADAEYDGRILDFGIDARNPVYTSFDIGVHDATCIVLFQCVQGKIYFIYAIEDNNKGMDHYWEELQVVKKKLGFQRWGYHWAPHDIRNREWSSSARTRISIAADMGLHFLIVPRVTIPDRIEAGRAFLPDCYFHATNCKHLVRCLREYRREFDEDKKIFKDKPLHNWCSHMADAYTYAAVAWRDQFNRPEENVPRKYKIG